MLAADKGMDQLQASVNALSRSYGCMPAAAAAHVSVYPASAASVAGVPRRPFNGACYNCEQWGHILLSKKLKF